MKCLYVCNTWSDYISKIDMDKLQEVSHIRLSDISSRIGPHGLCSYGENLLVANSYGNSLSIVDVKKEECIENYFIGMHCNDVRVYKDKAYIICGDCDTIVVFDLIKKRVLEEIPCGISPHSIDINLKNKTLVVSNMGDDSITLLDCENIDNMQCIKVGPLPTKAIFTEDGHHIIVCESNMGSSINGNISVISLKEQNRYKFQVGNSPVDLYCHGENCFVSNFGDGSISIINIMKKEIEKKINIGGMPRGIIRNGKYIYVGDNYKNLLIVIDIYEKVIKKIISIGGEPTGMIMI